MPPESDTRRLKTALVDVYRILNSSRVRDTTTRRSAVNVSAVAGGVLRHVLDEGPIRPVDLAQRVRLRPPALSRHLKNLEAEGCIERVPSPGDGRGALVRVTRRGRSAIERLEHRTGKHYQRLAEFAYFNEAGIRVRTLIQPEIDRDLTRVALVANH